MAILNVTESPYNAAGDGQTDDSQAIMDAIDDTTDGDTVYIPAGTYNVSEQFDYNDDGDFTSVFGLRSQHTGYSFAVEGDGAGTVLQQTDDVRSFFHIPMQETEGASDFDVELRNFVMDAGSGGPRFIWIGAYGGTDNYTGQSLHFQDLEFRNGYTPIQFLPSDATTGVTTVTGTRLSLIDNSDSGITTISTQDAADINDPSEILNVFQSIYVENTPSSGDGSTLHPSGTSAFRDVYAANCANANKISNDNVYVHIQNATFENFFQESGNAVWEESVGGTNSEGTLPYTFHFDNVAFRDITEMGAIRTGDEDRGEAFATGPIEIDGSYAGNEMKYGLWGRFNTESQMSFGEVRVRDAGGYEFDQPSLDGVGEADTVLYENATDPVAPDWTVGTLTQESFDALETPGPDDVGAFTAPSPQTINTDFADIDSWTPRRSSDASDWGVESISDNAFGDGTLVFNATAAASHGLSWDTADRPTDVEILSLVRIPSNDDTATDWGRLYARGDDIAEHWGWTSVYIDTGTNRLRIRINDGGNTTDLGVVDLADTAVSSALGSWFWRRFEVTGDTWRVRAWDLGDEEPSSWDIETTDSTISNSGYVGVGSYSADQQQFDYFAVATDGSTSPAVPTQDDTMVTAGTTATQRNLHERIADALDPTVDRPRPLVGALALSTDPSDINLNANSFDGEVARVEPSEPPTITGNTISYTFEFDESEAENETIERLVAAEDLDANAPSATGLLGADSFESDASNTITVQMDIDVLDISEGN